MPSYTLSPMFDPQFVPGAVAALPFATTGNPTAVPAGAAYQIAVARVANVTNQPVNLTLWRVPQGAAADTQHLVVPQIAIPPASASFPWMDLSTLWGIVLQPGDSIVALASVAAALVIHADGVIVGP
jgi:hypothetical protein